MMSNGGRVKTSLDTIIRLIRMEPRPDELSLEITRKPNSAVVRWHDSRLGFWDKDNLGEWRLEVVSDAETDLEVGPPHYPGESDTLEWGYQLELSAILKDCAYKRVEKSLLEAMGARRLFLDVRMQWIAEHEDDESSYWREHFLKAEFKASAILMQVSDDQLRRSRGHKAEPCLDWSGLAELYFDDATLAQDLEETAKEHYGVDEHNLSVGGYFPPFVLYEERPGKPSRSDVLWAIKHLEQYGIAEMDPWGDMKVCFGVNPERFDQLLVEIYQIAALVEESDDRTRQGWAQDLFEARREGQSKFVKWLLDGDIDAIAG
jgi:hypothetical protein